MKKILLLCLISGIQSAFPQIHPVAKESGIHFTIHNFGFKTGGILEPPKGDILFIPENLAKSYFRITLNSTSINTHNESRDNHLREENYFDVKNYPEINFISDSIRSLSNNGEYEAFGKLTIKKTTKEIRLPFKAEKSGDGYAFTGNFNMSRADYDIGGTSTISKDLTVEIKVVAR